MNKALSGRFLWGAFALSLAALLVADQSPPAQAAAKASTPPQISPELKPLQGYWEGVMVGDDAHQKITIRITGNSLHFHRDTNFWFDTTITLPSGTNPKQLHATIKACPPKDSIGQMVVAIFKIEGGTLTLATGNGDGEAPKSFEATGLNRYELRKVQPGRKIPDQPKPNKPESEQAGGGTPSR